MARFNRFVQQGASAYNTCVISGKDSNTAKHIYTLLNKGFTNTGCISPKIKRIVPRGSAHNRMVNLGFKAN